MFLSSSFPPFSFCPIPSPFLSPPHLASSSPQASSFAQLNTAPCLLEFSSLETAFVASFAISLPWFLIPVFISFR